MLELSFSFLSSFFHNFVGAWLSEWLLVLQPWADNSMRVNQLAHKGSIQSLFKALKVIILLGSGILNTPEPQISWGWRLESGLAWGWLLQLLLHFKPSMGKSSCLILSFCYEGLGLKKWFNTPCSEEWWSIIVLNQKFF